MLLGTISDLSGGSSIASAARTLLWPNTVEVRGFCAPRITIARDLRGRLVEPTGNSLISRSAAGGARIAPITSKSERRLR